MYKEMHRSRCALFFEKHAMLTKKTLLVGALAVTLGAGAISVGTTLAAEAGQTPKFVSDLAAAIAEEFDLDQSDVEAVIEEQAAAHREEKEARQDERMAEHEQKFEEMLAQAVEDGELTQDQADEIIEKSDEIRAYAETLIDMEPEERKDAMKERLDELKDWAEENDIPMEYVRFGPPMRGQQGQGHGGMGMK